MDRMLYVAMSGAKAMLARQDRVAHNLANAGTDGYRGEKAAFRPVEAAGEGLPTRVFTVDSAAGADLTAGPTRETGRSLDVAVQGRGWIAVRARDGTEAYTRGGALQLSASGLLETASGLAVQADGGGPISIPPDHSVAVGRDGTVSVSPAGQPGTVVVAGRIKLVDPPDRDLARGTDGLFRARGGAPVAGDPNVRLVPGALEGSNVNAVDALVGMIELARQFDVQMQLIHTADGNARQATRLLSINT